MKKRIVALLTATTVCMLSVSAFAATGTTLPDFEFLDVDQNGYISTEEAASCQALITDFAKVDANRDGKLDQAEYAAFGQEAANKG
jgi:Ca2+-binding EF-hand superfamily protein